MEGTSFQLPGVVKPFHILVVTGRRQTGKTHLACTAPGEIAIQSWDFGTNGVVQKHTEEKVIWVAEYTVEVDLSADLLYKDYTTRDEGEKLADKQADRIKDGVWSKFVKDRKAAFANPAIRTVVDDTATEMNETLRLANFGKLEKNPQLAYGPVNAEYKGLVRLAHTHQKNLVLIQQMGKVWKKYTDANGKEKEYETDDWTSQGNKKADYLVQSWVQMDFIPPVRNAANEVVKEGEFVATIEKARLNPQANGMKLYNPDWIQLMMHLAPDVPSEAWL